MGKGIFQDGLHDILICFLSQILNSRIKNVIAMLEILPTSHFTIADTKTVTHSNEFSHHSAQLSSSISNHLQIHIMIAPFTTEALWTFPNLILYIKWMRNFCLPQIGNALVCLAVYTNHSMRTVTNIFIVNLAVADFFVILLCLPPTVVWDVTETWFLGEVLCKVVTYFQVGFDSMFQGFRYLVCCWLC